MKEINWFGFKDKGKDKIKSIGESIIGLTFLVIAVDLFKNLGGSE